MVHYSMTRIRNPFANNRNSAYIKTEISIALLSCMEDFAQLSMSDREDRIPLYQKRLERGGRGVDLVTDLVGQNLPDDGA